MVLSNALGTLFFASFAAGAVFPRRGSAGKKTLLSSLVALYRRVLINPPSPLFKCHFHIDVVCTCFNNTATSSSSRLFRDTTAGPQQLWYRSL